MKKRQAVNEDDRPLSEAEKRRLARLAEISAELAAEGWQSTELTISIIKANAVVLAAAVPVFALGILLFYYANGGIGLSARPLGFVLFMLLYFALIVVHELIHGITWAVFAEHHWQDIEFGVMWKLLTPYCTCTTPLKKGQYIAGGLMPLIVLGIIPSVIAILANVFWLLLMGLIMILSAGGDVLIVLKLLGYKTQAQEILIYDHPTKGGSIIFERQAL